MIRRQLPAETCSVVLCNLTSSPLVRGLKKDRTVGAGLADLFYQMLTGKIPSERRIERQVSYDSQDVLLVAEEQPDGLVVASCKQYLGASAHPQPGSPLVQGLLDAGPVLLDQKRVHARKIGRYEADRILNEYDYLDISRVGVVLHVDAVLYELDHGQEHRRVTEPVEHVVDVRAVLALEDLGLAVVRRRRQRYERQRAVELLDLLCKALNAVASQIQHGYDEVILERLQQFKRLFLAARVGDFRRV